VCSPDVPQLDLECSQGQPRSLPAHGLSEKRKKEDAQSSARLPPAIGQPCLLSRLFTAASSCADSIPSARVSMCNPAGARRLQPLSNRRPWRSRSRVAGNHGAKLKNSGLLELRNPKYKNMKKNVEIR
jgi:hypothetical protein